MATDEYEYIEIREEAETINNNPFFGNIMSKIEEGIIKGIQMGEKQGIRKEKERIKKEVIKKTYNIGTEFRHKNIINIKDIDIWDDVK